MLALAFPPAKLKLLEAFRADEEEALEQSKELIRELQAAQQLFHTQLIRLADLRDRDVPIAQFIEAVDKAADDCLAEFGAWERCHGAFDADDAMGLDVSGKLDKALTSFIEPGAGIRAAAARLSQLRKNPA